MTTTHVYFDQLPLPIAFQFSQGNVSWHTIPIQLQLTQQKLLSNQAKRVLEAFVLTMVDKEFSFSFHILHLPTMHDIYIHKQKSIINNYIFKQRKTKANVINLHEYPPFFSMHSPRPSQGLSLHGFCL